VIIFIATIVGVIFVYYTINWRCPISKILFKNSEEFRIPKFLVQRVPLIQIPTQNAQNGKIKILLSEFHLRTNPTALL
jgi:hypothetical protein